MDLSTWVMIAVMGWTVVGLILVAALWTRAPWKAVLAWLGVALLPLGVWLVGLAQPAIDGWNTLVLWYHGLTYHLTQVIGLSVLGLAVVLLAISRLVPNRPRKQKRDDTPSATYGVTSTPARQEPEETLQLPGAQSGRSTP